MNKKIIFVVAILLIIAVVFAACKGNNDVEETTESTTEITVTEENNSEADGENLIVSPGSDVELSGDDFDIDLGDVLVIGGQEGNQGEDSLDWDAIG